MIKRHHALEFCTKPPRGAARARVRLRAPGGVPRTPASAWPAREGGRGPPGTRGGGRRTLVFCPAGGGAPARGGGVLGVGRRVGGGTSAVWAPGAARWPRSPADKVASDDGLSAP